MLMLNDVEYKVLKALEEGLPLTADPFGTLARQCGLAPEEFRAVAAALKARGVIRRIGVALRHHQAGVQGNIMAAFNVPQTALDDIGPRLAAYPQISHCYARKTEPDWPYNLYAMLHAPTVKAAQAFAANLCRELNIVNYVLLPTVAELKKSSVKLPDKIANLNKDGF